MHKSKVTWTNASASNNSLVEPKTRRHSREKAIDAHQQNLLEKTLKTGALFKTRAILRLKHIDKNVIQPPYQILVPVYSPLFKPGTLPVTSKESIAMYMFTIRVEEQGVKGMIRPLRHVFMINDSLYIIEDLNLIEPINDD